MITDNLSLKYRLDVYSESKLGFYIEARQMLPQKVLGPAIPLEPDLLHDLAKALMEIEDNSKGYSFIPEDLLFHDDKVIAIWTKPMMRDMKFIDGLKIKNGSYKIPGLIFCWNGRNLWAYCHFDKKPGPETMIYKTPFYNSSPEGSICLGNIDTLRIKDKPIYIQIKLMVQALFDSRWSHYQDAVRLKNMTLEEFYRIHKGDIPKSNYIKYERTIAQQIFSLL